MTKPWHRVPVARALTYCALLCAAASVFAQSYDNPSLGEKPVSAHPQDFKPLGIRAGSFMLHPGIELAGEWTDNVFYAYENEESDFIYHLRPYFTAQSTWSRHSFSVRLAADIGRHADYSFRDYEDYFLNIGGRIDVRSRSSFDYNLDYMRLHEDLNTRSAEQGIEPTVYTLSGYGLGFDHQFNRFTVRLNWYHAAYDFDDALRDDGSSIDNQDRDRDNDTFGLRLGYQFKTDMQAFASVQWHEVDYREEFDRNSLNRNSDGYAVSAGLRFGITGVLSGDVFVNYHDMDYKDPTFPNVTGWAGGAGLTWLPTQLTTVRATITSDVYQTTDASSPGYLGTLYMVRVDHELLRDLQISADVSYRDNDYTLVEDAPPDARAQDEVWRFGLGATYYFNRSLYVSASYSWTQLDTNVQQDGFTVNRVWLVLGLEK